MTSTTVTSVTARDNAQIVQARKWAYDAAVARRDGLCWLEGDHLVRAALQQGMQARVAFLTEAAWQTAAFHSLAVTASKVLLLPPSLMASISSLESAPSLMMALALPLQRDIDPGVATLVLDRIQDPGNVGSMLRSASAFGFKQVLATTGTAAFWSSKVLRAGMGAHFALSLHEQVGHDAVGRLTVPLVGTSLDATIVLGEASLPRPCAWVIGHEGQGVDPRLLSRCSHVVRIAQPGGEESLNAAVAAGICMHASLRG